MKVYEYIINESYDVKETVYNINKIYCEEICMFGIICNYFYSFKKLKKSEIDKFTKYFKRDIKKFIKDSNEDI